MRESRWSGRSEKYINYAGSSGGDGGGGGLWRRDCKLVRIKVMNINHGRLVLRSFPALDGLSPLHRPYRLPRSYPHSLVLQPCRPSFVLHREENWPTPSFYLRAYTTRSQASRFVPSPRRSSRVRCSSSRCQSARPIIHPPLVREFMSLWHALCRRQPFLLSLSPVRGQDTSTAELVNASTLILDTATALVAYSHVNNSQ